MNRLLKTIPVWALALLAGCHATVQHKVEPIHITLDVNLKVDRQLDNFFAFESEIEDEVLASEPAATGAKGGPSR